MSCWDKNQSMRERMAKHGYLESDVKAYNEKNLINRAAAKRLELDHYLADKADEAALREVWE